MTHPESEIFEKPYSAPLGRGSLTWRWFDNRTAFTGLSNGILQLMHPTIGAGVAEHSDFFNDPWDRIERSLPPIYGVVYDGADAETTGETIRGYHRGIHGTDEKGRRYNALNPDAFWWAHATFFKMTEDNATKFSHHNVTPADRARLYAENVTWYRRYGMNEDPMPPDYWSFREKWDDICENVLEMTPAAERAVEQAIYRDGNRLPMIPKEIWPIVKPPVGDVLGRLAIGGLPESVRKRFDIPFSRLDKIQYELFALSIRQNWWMVPNVLRYHPRALSGVKR